MLKNFFYIPAFFIDLGLPNEFNILLGIICLDIFTGVLRSYKNKGGNSIRSKVFAAGLLSKFLFLLIPTTLAFVGQGINIDLTYLALGCYRLMILSEFYSFLGNIGSIHTGKDMPEFDAIGMIIKQLRELVLKLLEKTKIDNSHR